MTTYPPRIIIYALAGSLLCEAALHPGKHPHPEERQPAAEGAVDNNAVASQSGVVAAHLSTLQSGSFPL